jgi:SAM-dependent methyltransferase
VTKPYSESCDQNKQPILSVIQPLLQDCRAVLEIGSGTGQHAVYFAAHMPQLLWYSSDQASYIEGIQRWLDDAGLDNTPAPVVLDVCQADWPALDVDAAFTANTLHIMHWHGVECTFAGAGRLLQAGGLFMVYGPFNYNNRYTSDSNARFDDWLKARDPQSGIRNFEDLDRLARQAGMRLFNDFEMPVNNRLVCWQKD